MHSLINTKDLGKAEIEAVLSQAERFKTEIIGRKGPQDRLCGTVATVFSEPSTRTSLSFQMAAQKLGLKVLNFSADTSSFLKGESLLDTLQTLEAIGVDLAVIRTTENWPELKLEHRLRMSLINAGSGVMEHPTQALLDALTIQQSFGRLKGLTVTIVGDVLHSRVARSNLHVLKTMGANVQFAGPLTFRPADLQNEAPWVDFEQAVTKSDVVMMLRIQFERHENDLGIAVQDYLKTYGLTLERINSMKEQAIIMHPGPVNRGIEIADEVMDHPKSKILQQVANGVYIRMALLKMCLKSNFQGELHEQLATA